MTLRESLMVGLVAFLMGAGGIAHLVAPDFFTGFVFPPLPPVATVIVTGVIQLAIGAAVLVPRTRGTAGLAFALLCLAYLPLHLWDFFREDPMISPLPVTIVRVFLQLAFIWLGWKVWTAWKPADKPKPGGNT